jgi:hypothetical protein
MVTDEVINTRNTLTIEVVLLPNLSINYPIERPPTTSPIPNVTSAIIDCFSYSSSLSLGIVNTIMVINAPA